MPFRAVHAETGADHVLWDEISDETVDAWRELGRKKLLLCPTCDAPMRVRAGEVYARHFAHFHRLDCPTLDDTPELRAARMAVYRWLRPKVEARGGTVTIEDWVRDAGLPRPIDVHVRFEDGKPGVAVWLHDRQLGPEKREALERALLALPAIPRWVFTERTHRPIEGAEDGINLSTLERDRAERTPFDALGPGLGSLHYLVEGNATLRTYRGLKLVHDPGTFRGLVREDPLEVMLLTRRGALVHPGEPEALAAWEAEQEVLRAEEEARLQRAAAEAAERARRWKEMERQRAEQRVEAHRIGHGPRALRPHRLPPSPPMPEELPRHPDEVECTVCGRVRRWVTRDGATGRAKCRDCIGKPYPPPGGRFGSESERGA